MGKPYIYALIDSRDGTLFYIGKGKGRRVSDHLKGYSHSPLVTARIAEIRATGREPEVRKLEFDTEEQAYAAERKLIDYVIKTSDTLVNQVGGGGGRITGHGTPSEEYRKSQAERSKARWMDPAYRERVFSGVQEYYSDPKNRERRLAQARKRFSDPKERERAAEVMRATNRSPSVRQKRRAQWAAKSDEDKMRFFEAGRAANRDPDVLARVIAKRKAGWADSEQRARRMEAILAAHATKWFYIAGQRFGRAVDAAAHFGVSSGTVYNWIKSGKCHVEDRNV